MLSVLELPSGRDQWLAAWRDLPDDRRDVHCHPDFLALHATGQAEPVCFLVSDSRGTALLAALRQPLPVGLTGPGAECDLQGCPGYNGFFVKGGDRSLLADLDALVQSWAESNGAIAEFYRLNPLLHDDPPEGYRVVERNRNVAIDLAPGPDAIRREQYEYSVRKQLAKADRAGLVLGIARSPQEVAAAFEVYAHTMERNGASQRQSLDHFMRAVELPDDLATLYTVAHGEDIVACELVTHGASVAYSYLGGTMAEAFPLAPNEFIKHGIVCDQHARGRRWFLLGGGMSPQDGIHRYKRKFSPSNDLSFRVASRIRLPRAYGRVLAQWTAAVGAESQRYLTMALPYRFP